MHIQLLFSSPLIILFLFVIINFIIDSCFTKKATTFKEYAIGYRQFATPTLVATILATKVSGSEMHFLLAGIPTGLKDYHFFYFLRFFYLAIVAIRRPFIQQHLSIAETLGSVYGKKVRVVAACCYLGLTTMYIAEEIYIIYWVLYWTLGSCLSGLLNRTDLQWLIAVIGLGIIIYTGGRDLRAVGWTDVLQVIIFTMIIPLFLLYTFMQTGKSGLETLQLLSVAADNIPWNWKNPMCLSFAAIIRWFIMLTTVAPQDMQHIYMAASPVQASKSFVYAGFFWLLIIGCIYLTGVCTFATTSLSGEVWLHIFFHMSALLRGVILCSILALIMSTLDSLLHVSSVLVNHDILPHIKGIQTIVAKYPTHIARVSSLVIGITILATVLFEPSSVFRWHSCGYFIYCMLAVPTTMAFWGIRGNGAAILIGMFMGLISTVLAWKVGVDLLLYPYYAVVVNAVAFFIAPYLLPQRSNSESDHLS